MRRRTLLTGTLLCLLQGPSVIAQSDWTNRRPSTRPFIISPTADLLNPHGALVPVDLKRLREATRDASATA